MNPHLPAICIYTLILLLMPGSCNGQTLRTLQGEVREQPSLAVVPENDSSSGNTAPQLRGDIPLRYSTDDDDPHSFVTKMVTTATLFTVASPFILPRYILKDEGQESWFPDFPYDGNQLSVTFDQSLPNLQDSMISFQTDTGTNFDGMLKTHFRLLADTQYRIGLDTEAYHWYERSHGQSDQLWTGDANLVYRFAQSEQWQFRAGLGMNWMTDSAGTELGINTTYSYDCFPRKPWYYSASLDWGRLGDSSLVHVRNVIGVTHRGWGFFTGHDYFHLSRLESHAWINGFELRY